MLAKHFPWCQAEKDELIATFAAYTARKRSAQVLDYDDLLLFWAALLRQPTIGEQMALYLFIAHDLAVVRHISSRIVVMYLGRVMETADRDELCERPLHYTKLLLDAAPIPDPAVEKARAPQLVQGELPSPLSPPTGCVFHTRCPIATAECRAEVPSLREIRPGHAVAVSGLKRELRACFATSPTASCLPSRP